MSINGSGGYSTPTTLGSLDNTTVELSKPILGVSNSDIKKNTNNVREQLFSGAHFVGTATYPKKVVAGQDIIIRGKAHFDDPISLVKVDMWVELHSPMLDKPKKFDFGKVQHCHTHQFEFRLPTPNKPGQQVAFTLFAEYKGVSGAVKSISDKSGPHRVELVTNQQKAASAISNYGPYVVIGGTVGGLAARNKGAGPIVAGVGVGAVGGWATKKIIDGLNNSLKSINPITAGIVVLGLGATGYALRQVNMLPGL